MTSSSSRLTAKSGQQPEACHICEYPQWDFEQCMPGFSFYAAVEARLPARNTFEVGADDPELLTLSASADAGCTGCRILLGVRRFARSFETEEEVFKSITVVRKFQRTSQDVEFEVNYENSRPSRSIDVFAPDDQPQPVSPGSSFDADHVPLNCSAESSTPRTSGQHLLNLLRTGDLIPSSTRPSNSLPWVRRCLSDCNSNHPCDWYRSKEGYTPHRLLDLRPGLLGGDIRLVDTLAEMREDKGLPNYACVSHCWGETRNSRLTTAATLVQNCERIPLDELPLTFRDAVELARELDIRYLWIDSMCIIQDSKEDWEAHVGRMTEIYGSGICTLAAADATSDDGGFFRDVHPNFLLHDQINVKDDDTDYKLYIRLKPEHPFRSQYADSSWPLFTRGWVLQEYMMSPRFIAFGTHEVFWSCFQASSCSCSARKTCFDAKKEAFRLDEVKVLMMFLSPASRIQLYPQWRRLIEVYGALQLTYASDRYAAIRGLASMFKTKMGDEYFEGMWRHSVQQDIAWMRWGKPSPRSNAASATSCSPSWSFMPMLMSGMQVAWLYYTEPSVYTVLDVQLGRPKLLHRRPLLSSSSHLPDFTEPVPDYDEFAPLDSGTITLEGILLRADFNATDSSLQAGLDHKLTMTLPDLPSLIDTHREALCALVPPLTPDELRELFTKEAAKQHIRGSQDPPWKIDEDKLAQMAMQGVHVLQTLPNYVVGLLADYDVEGKKLMEKMRDARFFCMYVQEQKKTVSGMLLTPRKKAQSDGRKGDGQGDDGRGSRGKVKISETEQDLLPHFERVGWLTCAMPQCEWFNALPKTRFALV